MNDGPSTGVGGEGTKSKGNNNIIINNLVGSRSSSGSNSSAAADAKEEEDGSNGAGDDHQMLDLSMGRREGEDEVASAAAQGNCDKLTETPAKGKSMEHEVAEIKKDPNEAEVDDGIGEEVGGEKAALLQDLEKCEEGTVMWWFIVRFSSYVCWDQVRSVVVHLKVAISNNKWEAIIEGVFGYCEEGISCVKGSQI